MGGRERVEAALALGLGDRPPVGAWGHTYREEWSPDDLAAITVERIADALVDFSRRSVEAGAAGVFYAISGYASKDALPEAVYRELVLPFDLSVLERLPSEAWFNVVHLCGSHLHFGLSRDLPVPAVSWS